VVWQGTNDPQYLRQVVLPGGRESVLCIPAPIILKTPRLPPAAKTRATTPARCALSIRPARYNEVTVSYAILDNNRFYAEGLRYALLRRGVQLEVQSDTVQWQPTLLTRRVIVVRCRFSVAGRIRR
jgi:hypothetical protein